MPPCTLSIWEDRVLFLHDADRREKWVGTQENPALGIFLGQRHRPGWAFCFGGGGFMLGLLGGDCEAVAVSEEQVTLAMAARNAWGHVQVVGWACLLSVGGCSSLPVFNPLFLRKLSTCSSFPLQGWPAVSFMSHGTMDVPIVV